jgi:hypothetical protein
MLRAAQDPGPFCSLPIPDQAEAEAHGAPLKRGGRDRAPRSRWGPGRMVEALDDWVGGKIVPSRDHRHFIDGSLSLDSFRVR